MTHLNVLAGQLERLEQARLSVGHALDRLALTPATYSVSAVSYSDISPDRLGVSMDTPEEARRLAVALGLEGPSTVKVRARSGRPGYARHEWSAELAGVVVEVWATDS